MVGAMVSARGRSIGFAFFLLVGCGEGVTLRGDSGTPRGDAGELDAGPAPLPDAGCPSGTHECSSGCVTDGENEPANGCMFGCGAPCPEPAMFGVAVCTEMGACAIECTPPAMVLDDTCVCELLTCEGLGMTCGTPSDGCGGTLECGSCGAGATCSAGACVCSPDGAEPNPNRSTAFRIGPFDNSDDPETTFTEFAIEDTGDEDWFISRVNDGTDGGNPVITVELSGIPEGSNYDIAAWFVCAGGDDATGCSAGAPNAEIGRGCISESTGTTSELVRLETECEHISTDDTGDLYVRVRPVSDAATCDPYSLRIEIH
jgi:hypothetical protein